MTFGDRLKQVRLQKGLTQENLAKKLGIGKTTITGYEKGNRQPDVQRIKDLAKILGVTGDYLLDIDVADAPTYTPAEQAHIKKYRTLDEHGKTMVDFVLDEEYGRMQTIEDEEEPEVDIVKYDFYDLPVSAGTGQYLDGDYKTTIEIPAAKDIPGTDFCLRISGDSMEPRFSDKDIVFVRKTDAVDVGRIGIFVINGESYIKKLGEGELISLNKNYDPIPINEYDTFRCLGETLGKL